MQRRRNLSEFELRVLLAVEATRGDVWKIRDELRRSGVAKGDTDKAKDVLERLGGDKLVGRVDDGYRLTETGRSAAHEAVERLRHFLNYASETLR